jgi:guanylate kinase
MIFLMGHSGSGKDTVLEILEQYGYKRIVSYTTRPPRHYEKDGYDYHFIDVMSFEKLYKTGFFIETTIYRDWFYGYAKQDFVYLNGVAILDPDGLQQVLLSPYIIDLPYSVIFVKALDTVRERRLLARGDNITEVYRRLLSDEKTFSNADQLADIVLYNNGNDLECLEKYIANTILPQVINKTYN